MSTDRPIKVLTVSSLYPSLSRPSFGVFVENRLRHLVQDMPVEAHVIAPVPWFPFVGRLFASYSPMANTPSQEVRHGLTVWHPNFLTLPRIGPLFNPFMMARSIRKVARGLAQKLGKIDVIDGHYLYPDGVAVSKVAASLGVPYVLTARGSDVTEIARNSSFYRKRIMKAVNGSAHTITVSESLRQELIGYGARPERVTALRNGIDTEKFQPTDISETKALSPRRTILFVGWLIPRKRPDIVLRAASLLPDVQVKLVGSGPLEDELKGLAADLGISGRTDFAGQIEPSKMPAVFSDADVLVLPSEREGWANVLLEAMACGTPVVARGVDGALDLVTTPEAGRLVDGDDPQRYAEALSDLFDHMPETKDVRAYAQNFTWRDISRAQYEIFAAAIADQVNHLGIR